jgi:hypothetical protein
MVLKLPTDDAIANFAAIEFIMLFSADHDPAVLKRASAAARSSGNTELSTMTEQALIAHAEVTQAIDAAKHALESSLGTTWKDRINASTTCAVSGKIVRLRNTTRLKFKTKNAPAIHALWQLKTHKDIAAALVKDPLCNIGNTKLALGTYDIVTKALKKTDFVRVVHACIKNALRCAAALNARTSPSARPGAKTTRQAP